MVHVNWFTFFNFVFKNQTLINTDRFNPVLPAETTTWFNIAIPAETTTWFMWIDLHIATLFSKSKPRLTQAVSSDIDCEKFYLVQPSPSRRNYFLVQPSHSRGNYYLVHPCYPPPLPIWPSPPLARTPMGHLQKWRTIHKGHLFGKPPCPERSFRGRGGGYTRMEQKSDDSAQIAETLFQLENASLPCNLNWDGWFIYHTVSYQTTIRPHPTFSPSTSILIWNYIYIHIPCISFEKKTRHKAPLLSRQVWSGIKDKDKQAAQCRFLGQLKIGVIVWTTNVLICYWVVSSHLRKKNSWSLLSRKALPIFHAEVTFRFFRQKYHKYALDASGPKGNTWLRKKMQFFTAPTSHISKILAPDCFTHPHGDHTSFLGSPEGSISETQIPVAPPPPRGGPASLKRGMMATQGLLAKRKGN